MLGIKEMYLLNDYRPSNRLITGGLLNDCVPSNKLIIKKPITAYLVQKRYIFLIIVNHTNNYIFSTKEIVSLNDHRPANRLITYKLITNI